MVVLCCVRSLKSMDVQECIICHDALDKDATGDDSQQWLACGHSFHAYCIGKYASSKNISLDEVTCPQCKMSPGEMKAGEQAWLDSIEAVSAEVEHSAANEGANADSTTASLSRGDDPHEQVAGSLAAASNGVRLLLSGSFLGKADIVLYLSWGYRVFIVI